MEVSLAAPVRNLLVCSTECACWHLCYSIFIYLSTRQRSHSLCSTRTSQQCEHTISRHQESPAEVIALSAVKRHFEDLAGLTLLWSLGWFSCRRDKQESHAAVWWGDHHSRTRLLGVLPFGSDTAQWSLCWLLPEPGAVITAMVKYWSVQRLIVILVQLFSLRSAPLYLVLALHQNPPAVCNFILMCRSQVQLHYWLCLPSYPFVSAALLFGNQSAFLFEKHRKKNRGSQTQVVHGGKVLEVEQDIARVWLLLLPNALSRESKVQCRGEGAGFCGFFSQKLHTKRSF